MLLFEVFYIQMFWNICKTLAVMVHLYTEIAENLCTWVHWPCFKIHLSLKIRPMHSRSPDIGSTEGNKITLSDAQ